MEKPSIGLVINNRYILVQYLGQGSFGEVWMAKDKVTNKDVALKLYLSLDEKGRDEFLSEYKIAYGLKHPNLVVTEVYDTWESRPFLVMKFCSRGSSSKVIGNLTPNYGDERFVWQFIHDVSAGLAYLHNQTPDPIVHQDIKPDNILVDSDGSFLISDFGISKRIRNTMRAQSTRALKAGAVAYMGPERFSKNPAPITASDIWSLGASIYELIEGELPFAGLGGVFLKNGGEMAELSNGWTIELNNVMQRCLAKETWDRMKAFEIEEFTRKILARFDVWYMAAPKIGDTAIASTGKRPDPRSTRSYVNTDNPFAGTAKLEAKKEENVVKHQESVIKPDIVEEKEQRQTSGIMKYVAAGVVAAVIGVSAMYFIGPKSVDQEVIDLYENTYMPLVEKCGENIQNGGDDGSGYENLIQARKDLEELEKIESDKADYLPEKFVEAQGLRAKYEEKAKPASEAWVKSAETQLKEFGNTERAIQYYQVAYNIYNDEGIASKIKELDKKRK